MLDIFCVTYNHGHKLHCFINSVLSQTSDKWDLHILHDGPNYPEWMSVKNIYPSWYIDYQWCSERKGWPGNHLRQWAIDRASHPYVLITNGDNYLCPVFVEEMLGIAERWDLDFVYCDMVHNQHIPGGNSGEYTVINTEPRIGKIDIGACIFKTKVAKTIAYPDQGPCSDGLYIEEILKVPNIKIAKIVKVLMVHN